MKKIIALLILSVSSGIAFAEPSQLAQGEWSMTADVSSPVHQTIHYTACNTGQSWGEWMTHQPEGQTCKNLASAAGQFDITCAKSLPNGMQITTTLHGDVSVAADAHSYHGEVSGGTIIPGMLNMKIQETIQGSYEGECKK